MSLNDFDLDKARELREKVKGLFVRQLRKEHITTVLVTAPLMVLILYASERWAKAPDSSNHYVILYFLGLLAIFVLWAVYGLSTRLLFVLKEIRQLRLDFLASEHAEAETATGGAESFSLNWPATVVKQRAVLCLTIAVFLLVPVVTAAVYVCVDNYRRMHWAEYEAFGGQEVVEIHVTQEGCARAFSRVSVTKCPSLVTSMPIHIAQADATLESVSFDGRRVPFSPVPCEEHTYSVAPGLPENALKNALLEVVWSFPVSDMESKIQLQGLIPINSYAVTAVIDTGAPYRFSGNAANMESRTLYWTKRPAGVYDAGRLGTCGSGIEAIQR